MPRLMTLRTATIGKVNMAASSRCDREGQMPQMHRELRRDFLVSQSVQKFQGGAATTAVKEDGALAPMLWHPEFAGIAAILIVRRTPDMLDAFLARHRADRAGFAFDDGVAHFDCSAWLRQVAIGMEVAHLAV